MAVEAVEVVHEPAQELAEEQGQELVEVLVIWAQRHQMTQAEVQQTNRMMVVPLARFVPIFFAPLNYEH